LISIDGSYGEGGGQILRTAIALSAVTNTPVEIKNIRANRPNPGIKAQHYTALRIVKELCNAETEGLEIGSHRVFFNPGEFRGGSYKFDIGTAGSIVLVCQACLLAAVRTTKPITLYLKGGTDVKWSPSWDYFTHVFLPLLRRIGVEVETRLIRRGYYPEGGGEAEIRIQPVDKLKPIKLEDFRECRKVEGIIHVTNLPEHIGRRMKHSAVKVFVNKGMDARINVETGSSRSTGTGITVWTTCEGIHLGKTMLGEKGVPAEEVGRRAAEELISELSAKPTVDVNLFDQLIPYMVLANGGEKSVCRVREISKHADTCMWLVSKFFDGEDLFKVEKTGETYRVEAVGRGL